MDKESNDHFFEIIKNKTKKLDIQKTQYELEIMQQNNLLVNNISKIQKLKCSSEVLHDEYRTLIRLLQKQGIIFEMNCTEYVPQTWENLFIVKASKGYEIQSKSGIGLMIVDERFLKIIQDIDKKDAYSLIVIRITDKTALVQLRFI